MKNMKKMRWKSVLLLFALIIGMFPMMPIRAAETTEVKVFITEGTLGHALNRSMTVGEVREGWGIELNKKRTVKSAVWSSSDTSVLTVEGNDQEATVTTHKEGAAKILLTVVTNENETVKHVCIVSSITNLSETERAAGYVKSQATFYRGASEECEVRNTAKEGQELTVIALCGAYYRVKLPESYDFDDTLNQDTAYVKKAEIEIPVVSVQFNDADTETALSIGEKKELSVITLPTLATRKKIEWSSSNDNVVRINEQGEITAIRKGTAKIQVREAYSGVTESITVQVKTEAMMASASRHKTRITLKKDNDLSGNYLTWNKPGGVSYFKIYVGSKKNKQKKVTYKVTKTTKKSYNHTKLEKGKKYYYYVKAYNSMGKRLATSNKVKIKATAPSIMVEAVDYKKLTITWKAEKSKHTKGISGYRIYRSDRAKGTYKCIKRINSKKITSWDNDNLPGNTTFYYKVCAFKKKGKKRINGAMSDFASAQVYPATVEEKTNWDYFTRNTNAWKGVHMEWGDFSEEESTRKMKDLSLSNDGKTYYPCIKYHLTPKTLYIHLYVEFCTYGDNNQKGPLRDEQFTYYGEQKDRTYYQEFRKGVEDAYSIRVQGNENDFAPGVQFDTKLVFHEKGNGDSNENQTFMWIGIGGECRNFDQCSSRYWFHTYPLFSGQMLSSEGAIFVYMPTNTQLAEMNYVEENPRGYRATAAHEMGHALGLDDAYEATGVSQLYRNHETCVYSFLDRKWTNIMESSRDNLSMTTNDIEMLLLAYGVANENINNVFQHYRDYGEHIVSDAIQIREDEY